MLKIFKNTLVISLLLSGLSTSYANENNAVCGKHTAKHLLSDQSEAVNNNYPAEAKVLVEHYQCIKYTHTYVLKDRPHSLFEPLPLRTEVQKIKSRFTKALNKIKLPEDKFLFVDLFLEKYSKQYATVFQRYPVKPGVAILMLGKFKKSGNDSGVSLRIFENIDYDQFEDYFSSNKRSGVAAKRVQQAMKLVNYVIKGTPKKTLKKTNFVAPKLLSLNVAVPYWEIVANQIGRMVLITNHA